MRQSGCGCESELRLRVSLPRNAQGALRPGSPKVASDARLPHLNLGRRPKFARPLHRRCKADPHLRSCGASPATRSPPCGGLRSSFHTPQLLPTENPRQPPHRSPLFRISSWGCARAQTPAWKLTRTWGSAPNPVLPRRRTPRHHRRCAPPGGHSFPLKATTSIIVDLLPIQHEGDLQCIPLPTVPSAPTNRAPTTPAFALGLLLQRLAQHPELALGAGFAGV